MKIQEKIWVVLESNGKPLEAFDTRKKAREARKTHLEIHEEYGELADYQMPLSIVQYKRWKKAN